MSVVYHSDRLPQNCPAEYQAIQRLLAQHSIRYAAIPNTRDIWCRDYMPVVASDGKLVQFVYWPRYLRNRKSAGLITPPCCYRHLPFADEVRESVIILDGGTIEVCGGTGIVTERVFEDNAWYDKGELVEKLKQTLKLDTLIVIPVEPGDETGHVDGVVRFVGTQQVVLNDYARLGGSVSVYGKTVESRLRQHGLDKIHYLPYAPVSKIGPDGMPEAMGCYINYLRTGNLVLLPQFGISDDPEAIEACNKIFDHYVVETIDCSKLARGGGVLNCISWTF